MNSTPERPNGCFNHKPYVDTVEVQDGYLPTTPGTRSLTRAPFMKTIPNPMSKPCQYTLHQNNYADPRCVGCIWQRTPQLDGVPA